MSVLRGISHKFPTLTNEVLGVIMQENYLEGMSRRARRMRELDALIDEIFGSDFLRKEELRNEKSKRS